MRKIALIALILIWISCLIILIMELTDLYPNNVFKEYRMIVVIGFIAATGFLRVAYKQIFKLKTN